MTVKSVLVQDHRKIVVCRDCRHPVERHKGYKDYCLDCNCYESCNGFNPHVVPVEVDVWKERWERR